MFIAKQHNVCNEIEPISFIQDMSIKLWRAVKFKSGAVEVSLNMILTISLTYIKRIYINEANCQSFEFNIISYIKIIIILTWFLLAIGTTSNLGMLQESIPHLVFCVNVWNWMTFWTYCIYFTEFMVSSYFFFVSQYYWRIMNTSV